MSCQFDRRAVQTRRIYLLVPPSELPHVGSWDGRRQHLAIHAGPDESPSGLCQHLVEFCGVSLGMLKLERKLPLDGRVCGALRETGVLPESISDQEP